MQRRRRRIVEIIQGCLPQTMAGDRRGTALLTRFSCTFLVRTAGGFFVKFNFRKTLSKNLKPLRPRDWHSNPHYEIHNVPAG